MNDPNWIPIDPKNLRVEQRTDTGGVQTIYAPSPYDLPDAIAIETDSIKRTLTIRFRYIENDRIKMEVVRKDVSFLIGRASGRLYGIEVVVSNPRKADVLRRAIEEGLRVVSNNAPRERKSNFRAAKDAVASTTDALVRQAAAG
jgi:hypothetical protein